MAGCSCMETVICQTARPAQVSCPQMCECTISYKLPFPRFTFSPSTRKASHYLLTPYLNTSSQEWKNQLFVVYECALNHPLFFPSPCMVLLCSCEGTGQARSSSAPRRQLGSNPLSCSGKSADGALFHRLSPNPAGWGSGGIILD